MFVVLVRVRIFIKYHKQPVVVLLLVGASGVLVHGARPIDNGSVRADCAVGVRIGAIPVVLPLLSVASYGDRSRGQ